MKKTRIHGSHVAILATALGAAQQILPEMAGMFPFWLWTCLTILAAVLPGVLE